MFRRYVDKQDDVAPFRLALEEVLLDRLDECADADEAFLLWESIAPAVVLGRSSAIDVEAKVEACRADGVPIWRRISGGATVLAGPGCLMYALVLDLRKRPELQLAEAAHRTVLEPIAAALSVEGLAVERKGISDLAMRCDDGAWRKVSGNSVRIKRRAILYHGTLLYDFPLDAIERYLGTPPRRPDYREDRPHGAFVANLPLDRETVTRRLESAWPTESTVDLFNAVQLHDEVDQLFETRYASEAWTRDGRAR